MDFLQHLIDAPVANIFIVAGLLFLGIGAVGKITGKIEPDKSGRLMAGFLGLILLIAGLIFHVRADSASNNASNPAPGGPIQPIVHVFSVTPTQITKGNKVTIRWEVLNADDVELDPFGQVGSTGSTTDQPQQTTVYKLSASNRNGGKAGDFREVIVNEHEPASTEKQTKEIPPTAEKPTKELLPSGIPVPDFGGTWELIEHQVNGQVGAVTQKEQLTILQKGSSVWIRNKEYRIDSTGKATDQEFFASDNQFGHAVKTDAEADMDETDTFRLEGPFLINETTWLTKRQFRTHPPGTQFISRKFRRISPGK